MASKLSTHQFVFDGVHDPLALKPVECCATCGLPRRHERHEIPAQDPDVTYVEARRQGEKIEKENA